MGLQQPIMNLGIFSKKQDHIRSDLQTQNKRYPPKSSFISTDALSYSKNTKLNSTGCGVMVYVDNSALIAAGKQLQNADVRTMGSMFSLKTEKVLFNWRYKPYHAYCVKY